MTDRRKISFSLTTLLLLVVIAALIVSHVVMKRQVADARAELAKARAEIDEVRRKFGYIRVENDKQIFITRITEDRLRRHIYRIRIPQGQEYLLHLSEATFETLGPPVDAKPTKTVSLNEWIERVDVVLTCAAFFEESTTSTVRVSTQTDPLFHYRMENWTDPFGPADASDGWHLKTGPQEAFSLDETICLAQWRDCQTKRGIMIWMEPAAAYKARLSSE